MVISSTVCTQARLEEILPAASAATTGSGATRLKPPFRPTFPEVGALNAGPKKTAPKASEGRSSRSGGTCGLK